MTGVGGFWTEHFLQPIISKEKQSTAFGVGKERSGSIVESYG
jgi:hypothetical protein